MQSGESIYNLIPSRRWCPPGPHAQEPASGRVDPRDFGMGAKRANATLGRSPGSLKPDTSEFLRKNPEDTLRSRASNGPPDLPPGPRRAGMPNLDASLSPSPLESPLDHARAHPPRA